MRNEVYELDSFLYDLRGFGVDVLMPVQRGSPLTFAILQKDSQSLLDAIHQVLGGVGVASLSITEFAVDDLAERDHLVDRW